MTFLNFTPIRHQEFVNNLCTELQYGFRVGYKGKRFPRVATNLPFATQQPEVIEANLLEEVRLGRVAGLFKSLPFKNFQIHPLGLVHKERARNGELSFIYLTPKGLRKA